MTENLADTRLEITRDVLHRNWRATAEQPPLFRGETSESPENQAVEIPMPRTLIREIDEIRVLHVDDNAQYTELTKTFLERDHDQITVVTETSAIEGLSALNEHRIDCVVSDYDMPTTNGLEFLELVREQYPDIPFILFTGAGDEDIASRAISAGVTDYVRKQGGSEQYEVLANRIDNAVDMYRTQQQFWDALTWYQRLVDQDLIGVFIMQGHEFIYVNECFADIFGCDQTDLIGREPAELVCKSHEGVLARLFDEKWKGETFREEFEAETEDGDKLTVEVHGGPVQCAGEPGCIGLAWDK